MGSPDGNMTQELRLSAVSQRGAILRRHFNSDLTRECVALYLFYECTGSARKRTLPRDDENGGPKKERSCHEDATDSTVDD
jgi:hypothetical protein